jgi:hypothetical protein
MANTVTVLLNSVRDIVFDVADTSGKIHYIKILGSGSKIRNEHGVVIPSSHLPGAGSYGVTHNVDADLWAEVEKTYGSMSIFKKGYIKATTPKTEKAAREELATKENGEEPEATQESGKKRGRRKASN